MATKENKPCTKCLKVKSLDSFNFKDKKRGRLNSHCRDCTKKASKIAYRKRRKYYIKANYKLKRQRLVKIYHFINQYLFDKSCVDCGINDPLVLQFDHVRGRKDMAIAEMITHGYGKERIKQELKKCDVRCANCHTRRTAQERNFYKLRFSLDKITEM